jgi:hypothetical protein
MISDHDRSGYFGASDVDKVVGNWSTKTFEKWWMQKIGVNRNHFSNQYTVAGTHFEHRILESLGIPMELDKQIIIEALKLRVNLDGNTEDTIYECKSYKYENGFKMPKKYIQQVQVQMFASGLRKAKIVVYGLVEADYDNFFRPIDPSRRDEVVIAYDERWINEVFLPKLRYLAKCLEEGRFPQCA